MLVVVEVVVVELEVVVQVYLSTISTSQPSCLSLLLPIVVSMERTRLGSQSEKADKRPKCLQKFGPKNSNVIGCSGCNLWWHSDCAEIDTVKIKVLAKYRTVHWFCDSCDMKQQQRGQDKILQHVDSMISKIATQLLTDLPEKLLKMQEHITELKQDVPKYRKTYAKTLGFIPLVAEKEPITSKVTKLLRDPDKIVIVTRTAIYGNSIRIKKEFAKIFH